MTLLAANGSPIGYRSNYTAFRDDFERGAAGVVTSLGGDWVNLSDAAAAGSYDPIAIRNGAIITAALTRSAITGSPWCPNPANTMGAADFPNHPGTLAPGIGGAYRETGTTHAKVKVGWAGNWGPTSGHHTEVGACVHFDPTTTDCCVGAWITFIVGGALGVPLVVAGALGRPPETPRLFAATAITHVDGQHREISVETDGTGYIILIDDAQVSMSTYGLSPIPVPVALQSSTRHGFAIDQHVVDYTAGAPDLARMQSTPAITDVLMILR